MTPPAVTAPPSPLEVNGVTLTEIRTVDVPVIFYERTFDAGRDALDYAEVAEGKVIYVFRTNRDGVSRTVRELVATGDGAYRWSDLTVGPSVTEARPPAGQGGSPPVTITRAVGAERTGRDHRMTLSPTVGLDPAAWGTLHFLLAPEPLDDYRLAHYVLNPGGLLARRSLSVDVATLYARVPAPPTEHEADAPPAPPSQAFLTSVRFDSTGMDSAPGASDRYWGLILADHWALVETVSQAYEPAAEAWRAAQERPDYKLRLFHAGMTEVALRAYEVQEAGGDLTPEEVQRRRPRWKGWRLLKPRHGPGGLDAFLQRARTLEERADRLGRLLYEHLLPHPETRQAVVDRFSPYLPAPVRFDLSEAMPSATPERLDRLAAHADAWAETASAGDLDAVTDLVAAWSGWTRPAGLSRAGQGYLSGTWAEVMDPGHYVVNSVLLVRRLLMGGAAVAGTHLDQAGASLDGLRGRLEAQTAVLTDRVLAHAAAGEAVDDARLTIHQWQTVKRELRSRVAARIDGLDQRATRMLQEYDAAVVVRPSEMGRMGGNAAAMSRRLRRLRTTLLARYGELGLPLPGAPGGYPLGLPGTTRAVPRGLSAGLTQLWAETYWLWAGYNATMNDVEFPQAYLEERRRRYVAAGQEVERSSARAEAEVARARREADAARAEAERTAGSRDPSRVPDDLRRRLDRALNAQGELAREAADADRLVKRFADDLRAQEVDVARIGRGAVRWERAAIGLHFVGVWFAGAVLLGESRGLVDGVRARGGRGLTRPALELVGLASAALDLAASYRHLRSIPAGGTNAAAMGTLRFVRVSAALETVYFGAYAATELSEGDVGAAAGYGAMAGGSALVFAGTFGAMAGLGPIGIALIVVGIVAVVLFSDSQIESWLKQSVWGLEAEYDRLDRTLAWVGLRDDLTGGDARLTGELVSLFQTLASPRVWVQLVVGDELYHTSRHRGSLPDLRVRVEPGLFDPETMQIEVDARVTDGTFWDRPLTQDGRFSAVLPRRRGGFVEAVEDGRFGWTARRSFEEAFGPVEASGRRVLSALGMAEGHATATFSFTDAAVAGQPSLADLNRQLRASGAELDGTVGHTYQTGGNAQGNPMAVVPTTITHSGLLKP